MKKYIRSATDRSNRGTWTKSQKFSPEEIERRAREDSRRGESMQQIWTNIQHDPDITFGTEDDQGKCTIYYKGENVGWVDYHRGIGDINNVKYTQIKKAAKQRPDYGHEYDESEEEFEGFVDESYDDMSDVEFDDEEY